jgi:hypothetical protein
VSTLKFQQLTWGVALLACRSRHAEKASRFHRIREGAQALLDERALRSSTELSNWRTGPHWEGTRKLLTTMPFVGNCIFRFLLVVLLCLTFSVFYALMPNTKVHWQAAASVTMLTLVNRAQGQPAELPTRSGAEG